MTRSKLLMQKVNTGTGPRHVFTYQPRLKIPELFVEIPCTYPQQTINARGPIRRNPQPLGGYGRTSMPAAAEEVAGGRTVDRECGDASNPLDNGEAGKRAAGSPATGMKKAVSPPMDVHIGVSNKIVDRDTGEVFTGRRQPDRSWSSAACTASPRQTTRPAGAVLCRDRQVCRRTQPVEDLVQRAAAERNT